MTELNSSLVFKSNVPNPSMNLRCSFVRLLTSRPNIYACRRSMDQRAFRLDCDVQGAPTRPADNRRHGLLRVVDNNYLRIIWYNLDAFVDIRLHTLQERSRTLRPLLSEYNHHHHPIWNPDPACPPILQSSLLLVRCLSRGVILYSIQPMPVSWYRPHPDFTLRSKGKPLLARTRSL